MRQTQKKGKTMKITQPTFTLIPNVIYDYWLPHLEDAELRIILLISRQTLSSDKEKDKISFSEIKTLSNLSEKKIFKGIQNLLRKELIIQEIIEENGIKEIYYKINIEREI